MRWFLCLLLGFGFMSTSTCPAVTCSDLVETGPLQRRWMTLPESRIVVNPYDFNSRRTPLQQSGGPDLPLHLAYYAGGECLNLRNVLRLHQQVSATPAEIRIGWTAPLTEVASWMSEPKMRLKRTEDGLQVTATGPNGDCSYCGSTSQSVEIDLDAYQFIQIDVPTAVGHWALKVRDPDAQQDVTLQSDTQATGVFAYNVREATGWTGRKRFDVKLFAINIGKPVTLGELKFVGMSSITKKAATEWKTRWQPHQLGSTATIGERTRIDTLDAFVDLHSLHRRYAFSQVPGGTTFTISGEYNGRLHFDTQKEVLSIEGSTSMIALAFRGAKFEATPAIYRTAIEFLAGVETTQPVATASALWALPFSMTPYQNRLDVGVGLSTAQEGPETARLRALSASRAVNSSALQQQVWNDYLAKVPKPENFAIRHVESFGVTATDVEAAYYKAWIFTAANLLPVMPETGFNYRQLAAGKPAMWGDGHPLARATASWESLFAMQFYAHVDPEAAWDAFIGLMSLVDENGRLGGESLPSRKAQTAIILYRLSKDREKLEQIYPALKRYLLWRRDNPRWIHKAHDYLDEKDSDFVVSAIVDMAHAREIAKVLEMPDEVALWEREREALFAKYLEWFWKTPEANPHENYFLKTKRRGAGVSLWVASGIHLDLLKEGPYLDGLYRVYQAELKPDKPFLGFGIPKYPEISFLVYGLTDRGRLKEAAELANAAVRDVTRANMFAEQYLVRDFPEPDGVRPSMFGAAMLIDMIWIKNGLRFDTGVPVNVKLPGETGKVQFRANANQQQDAR